MGNEYGYNEAFIDYRRSQNKFDYFLLAVILGTLSLSVQIHQNLNQYNSIYLLYSSWLLAFIAFLSGLLRLERINMFLKVEVDKIGFSNRKLTLELMVDSPTINTNDVTKSLKNIDEILTLSEKFIKFYLKYASILYQIEKWTYIYSLLIFLIFRLSNIISLSIFYEALTIGIIIILNRIFILIYKKYFLPSDDNK